MDKGASKEAPAMGRARKNSPSPVRLGGAWRERTGRQLLNRIAGAFPETVAMVLELR